jgi:predicted NBD/HSP70 family sugar kinase
MLVVGGRIAYGAGRPDHGYVDGCGSCLCREAGCWRVVAGEALVARVEGDVRPLLMDVTDEVAIERAEEGTVAAVVRAYAWTGRRSALWFGRHRFEVENSHESGRGPDPLLL